MAMISKALAAGMPRHDMLGIRRKRAAHSDAVLQFGLALRKLRKRLGVRALKLVAVAFGAASRSRRETITVRAH